MKPEEYDRATTIVGNIAIASVIVIAAIGTTVIFFMIS